MIQKPTIVITSLGRTGTKFFRELFAEILPDATALHEPDYLNFGQYRGTGRRIAQVIRQIGESGAGNLLFRKVLGRWSLIELSDARVRDEMDRREAARRAVRQRERFVQSQSGSIYVESSSAYYGLVDVLPHVFRQHRVVYIVRDGRDWVRSKMNWGNMYDKDRIRGLLSHTWPTAPEMADDPHRDRWPSMTLFEKRCWGWARLNAHALEMAAENPDARVFRFEDIFQSERRYENLEALVRFATALPETGPVAAGSLAGWLERQIHRSERRFPAWEGWSDEQQRQFRALCGPLMEKLGYDLKKSLNRSSL